MMRKKRDGASETVMRDDNQTPEATMFDKKSFIKQ
jgi:hypothetical protein